MTHAALLFAPDGFSAAIPLFMPVCGGGGLLGLALLALWVWALVDCATKEPAESNDKIIWILIILFASVIGAVLYLVIRRPQRQRLYGR